MKRTYKRGKGTLEPEAAILVVTEGEKTEPVYLGELRERLHLAATRVEISQADGTDPGSIVAYAMTERDRRRRGARRGEGVEYEAVWVVFDSEQRLGTVELTNALTTAANEGISVAMSSPCFEYWLILHFEYTTAYMCSYDETKKRLKQHVKGYDKSAPPTDELMPLLEDAMLHAARCRKEQDKVGAELPRTDVDALVAAMNCAAREHNRLLDCPDEHEPAG